MDFLSADQAVDDILRWVENGNCDEDDVMDVNGPMEEESTTDGINQDEDNSNQEEDDDNQEEEPRRREFYRRLLTYQRDVNSIDTSLDEENYNCFIPPEKEKRITGYLPDKADTKKKTAVTFTNKKPSVTGRQKRADVLPSKPGLTKHTRNITTPREAFEFFMTDEIIQEIVDFTNIRIDETLVLFNVPEESRNKYSWMKQVDLVEMKAFFGLLYYRGLYNWNTMNVDILFSERLGAPVFSQPWRKTGLFLF